MDSYLKNELREKLLLEGHTDIVAAIDKDDTNNLSTEKKQILINFSNAVKNGGSTVQANLGFAGASPSSGGSGFLSGQRSGIGHPDSEDEP